MFEFVLIYNVYTHYTMISEVNEVFPVMIRRCGS